MISLLICLAVCALLVADLILWCIFVPPYAPPVVRCLPGSGFYYYIRSFI